MIESPLFGILLGLGTGIIIGYLWRDEQEQSARTIGYPEPKEEEKRLTGEIIKNPFEHIMKLTPEQNARTKGNKP